MKIEVNKAEPSGFIPVVVTVVLQSQEEVDAFYAKSFAKRAGIPRLSSVNVSEISDEVFVTIQQHVYVALNQFTSRPL